MRAFVTVGSTQFDALIESVLSEVVLATLQDKGYSTVVIQCGKYHGDKLNALSEYNGTWSARKSGVTVEVWRYKPSLKEDFEAADLVLSHAGINSFRSSIPTRLLAFGYERSSCLINSHLT